MPHRRPRRSTPATGRPAICGKSGHRMSWEVQSGDWTEALAAPESGRVGSGKHTGADILLRCSKPQALGNTTAPAQCGHVAAELSTSGFRGRRVPLWALPGCAVAFVWGGLASFAQENLPSLPGKKWLVPVKETQCEHSLEPGLLTFRWDTSSPCKAWSRCSHASGALGPTGSSSVGADMGGGGEEDGPLAHRRPTRASAQPRAGGPERPGVLG